MDCGARYTKASALWHYAGRFLLFAAQACGALDTVAGRYMSAVISAVHCDVWNYHGMAEVGGACHANANNLRRLHRAIFEKLPSKFTIQY